MCTVAFDIPNEVLYDTKMSSGDTVAFVRRAAALQYYSTRGVSLGYCAQIAGMCKEDFIDFLSQNGISIFHFDDRDEFLEELENA